MLEPGQTQARILTADELAVARPLLAMSAAGDVCRDSEIPGELAVEDLALIAVDRICADLFGVGAIGVVTFNVEHLVMCYLAAYALTKIGRWGI
jgi:hypothetical protein